MTDCKRIWCGRTAVWEMRYPTSTPTHYCNKHTVRHPEYRKRAVLPASSPQLTLEEVAHV